MLSLNLISILEASALFHRPTRVPIVDIPLSPTPDPPDTASNLANMGGQVSKMMGKIFGTKEMRILMLGLDAAGKTSMIPGPASIEPRTKIG